jgi:hypothetical protein
MPGVRCFPLMSNQYYILWYRLDGGDSFLIWYSDEEDRVLVDADGFVPSFKDRASLLGYAAGLNIRVDVEGPKLLNLDVLRGWLERENDGLIDPDSFNDAWNLFADLSRSIGGDFDPNGELTRKIYDKLFWGCNLPVVTPEGGQYHPAWTKRELKVMRDVLSSGLRMFRSSVRGL